MLRKENLPRVTPLVLIIVPWALILVLVNPIGDFPLNDDWSYGRAVHSLIEHGKLEFISGWTSQSLIVQVLWGALFCLPCGFSFTALRFSTLILALLGLFATDAVLREVGATRRLALFGTAIVAVNPLYLCLANTFMTDVPFFTLAVASLLFFIRALKSSRMSDLCGGVLLAILATFVRQLGIAIPMAFGAAYLYKNGLSKRTLPVAFVPAILTIAALGVYQSYLQFTGIMPEMSATRSKFLVDRLTTDISSVLRNLRNAGAKSTVYLGILLLPFSLLFCKFKSPIRYLRESRWSALGFLTIAGLLSVFVMKKGKLMPMLGNLLYNLGLGPPTLRDVHLLKLSHLPTAPQWLWLLLTIFGIAGGAALLLTAFQGLLKLFVKQADTELRAQKSVTLFLAGIAALYLVPLSVIGFFDRFLLFYLPLTMILLLNTVPAVQTRPHGTLRLLSVAILILLGAFAIGGTHDYLNWNRVRWKALRELTERKGVPPCHIDGGFEFNGWYCYDEHYSEVATRSWWWVKQDDYVVAFGQISGFVEEKKFEYIRWIPPSRGHIFLLRKAPAQEIAATSSIGERPRSPQ